MQIPNGRKILLLGFWVRFIFLSVSFKNILTRWFLRLFYIESAVRLTLLLKARFYMKKIFLSLCLTALLASQAYAQNNIKYGYNPKGEYVPIEIDGKKIEYGYNPRGDYVATKVGNENIEYGYNPNGEYVPTQVGNKKIDYGYNANGAYVPTQIGNERIEYGYNPNGEYVPTQIGNKKIDYGYNANGAYVPTNIGSNSYSFPRRKFLH